MKTLLTLVLLAPTIAYPACQDCSEEWQKAHAAMEEYRTNKWRREMLEESRKQTRELQLERIKREIRERNEWLHPDRQ